MSNKANTNPAPKQSILTDEQVAELQAAASPDEMAETIVTLSSVQSMAQEMLDANKVTKAQLLELAAMVSQVPARPVRSSKPARRTEKVFNSEQVVPLGELSEGGFFTRNGRDLHYVQALTPADGTKWRLTSVVYRAADKDNGALAGSRLWRGFDSAKTCRAIDMDAVPSHVLTMLGIEQAA